MLVPPWRSVVTCGEEIHTHVTVVRGDSGNNPQRDTWVSQQEFSPGQTGFFLMAEVEFDVDLEVGLKLELNNPNWRKAFLAERRALENTQGVFFPWYWNHSVSPEHQEWGWGRWWQRFRRRKSWWGARSGPGCGGFRGLTCFTSFYK